MELRVWIEDGVDSLSCGWKEELKMIMELRILVEDEDKDGVKGGVEY